MAEIDIETEIADAMANFDWEAAHQKFKQNRWRWARLGQRGMGFIPDVPDLQKAAKELLREAGTNKYGMCGSGRLTAKRVDGRLVLTVDEPKKRK